MMSKNLRKGVLLMVPAFFTLAGSVFSQQITVPRIEEMPDLPQPYLMRDWKQVAIGYDRLVYDLEAEGEYKPFTGLYSSTTNYPEHGSFHQQTYVGQPLEHNEAINSMMGVIGASLCGIDKSNQDGHNWVLMTEEFFNRKNGQLLYLNNVGAKTGHDWWYETIPNVLFYQLYSLYPETGHFSEQFLIVADRWLEAMFGMGGSSTPWTSPYMNFRSFNLETMEPLATGVPEPEAAGALAWIFYQAYSQTGIEKYRVGAELSMEYFSQLEESPVYELQYLYGAMAAARMNAELGTNYNLEKIVNWCFDVGPLRVWAHTTGWGVTVGTWNGIDASGLTGAISRPDNTTFGDYAFLMNSFQQAGIMAPLVRYNDRYARAMGKYLLNMANSARLFYSKYLPDANQDCADWSGQNDPDSYIAYEAVRKYKEGKSPFATGDAMGGGWAPTNLSLYSSSPAGYLGGILDTTDVEGVLKFDLLKTDFFHLAAYPSYLMYNPYGTVKEVTIDVGSGLVDIYDAVSNSKLNQSASGETQVMIGPDQAVVMVLIPAGAAISQEGNTILCNDVAIDYIPETMVPRPMRMKALAAEDSVVTVVTESVSLYCTATSPSPGQITYAWSEQGIEIGNGASSLTWISPKKEGEYWITCTISDGQGESITDSVKVKVVDFINHPPVIERIALDPSRVNPGDTAHLTCGAFDPDGGELSWSWSSGEGTFTAGNAAATTWNAPLTPGIYTIYCEVEDEYHETALDSTTVRVIDQSSYLPGNLVAHYPFNNNVEDYSGFDNHGIKHSVSFIKVRDGAYDFNGTSSYVEVPASEILNCNDAITVTFWMKPTQLYDRETYPISHGLWHNRWKVSVSNNIVRWTIRTLNNGSVVITDLDSKTTIEKDRFCQVTTTYDGEYSELYIDAGFEGFLHQSGTIEDTDIAMTIGQASPSATGNNFKGVLDEVRIYDYALSHDDIKEAYRQDLLVKTGKAISPPIDISVYPNPSQQLVSIAYILESGSDVTIEIRDILSRRVKTVFNGSQLPGSYSFTWDGSSDAGHPTGKGIYLCTMVTGNDIYARKIIRN